MIKIDSGIPVPASNAGRKPKYPFEEMDVGQSFFEAGDSGELQKNAISSVSYFRRKHPDMRFTVRRVDGGIRVWRTE